MTKHPCVFISHSSEDREIILRFAEALRNAKISYWLDLDLPPGSSYAREIIKGIDESPVFLLVYSAQVAAKSDDVLNEIEEARRTRKIIIPVRIDSTEYTDDFKYHLNRLQWIDAANKEENAVKMEIVAAISRALNSLGISVANEATSSANVIANQTISSASYGMKLNSTAQCGSNYTLSQPSVNSSYASAWKLVPHSFKRNEGVVFPAQWDGMLDAFWKAWSVKSEEAMRQATSLFLKADQHDPELQYRIGTMLSLGWFGESQRAKAKAWYEAAAGKGNYMAMLGIGDCYRTATGGFPQNQEISQSWYVKALESMKRAAIKGDGRAMYHAGRLCRFGFLGEEYPKEGIAFWEKSVQTGNCEAQHWLSREYASGEFVAKNMNKAVSLCVDSAVGGLVSAMTKMGRYCKEGVPGVMNASLNDALKWYQLAEAHGKPHSCKSQIDELLSR